ncbi:uncharacterized protein BO95DRAFT_465762 [Aspergillus brunneoviolaceus CBS 621.78]|uniref:Uncharacterized protein n=1 Tax=Aspergillus brunneoviolaceus CBS 621.78 TaxID=1450534 RepID=A0ACD1G2X1_9EURO|nr:hypothetical protein BO95DRAFT_465762 [Aspergillus brunneoviolaceus CBS 621.78]RAH43617.1 hypothetical protein BO95DRAFT_465762 [Aspergillus brunneoviolaceus CBS 621.78]
MEQKESTKTGIGTGTGTATGTATGNETRSHAVCTQEQVRYECGHSKDGRFIKCKKHKGKPDLRCHSGKLDYVDTEWSSHKCRWCLDSD